MIRIIFILFFMVMSCLAGDAYKTLELRQGENGYEGAEDVALDYQLQGRLDHNFGAAPIMAIYCSGGKILEDEKGEVMRNENGWVKMAFLRFDLSVLPSDAKIQSIKLILHVISPAPRNVPHRFELRSLLKDGLIFGSSMDLPEEGAVSAAWSKTASEGWGNGNELMPRVGADIESYAFAEAVLEEDATELVFENLPEASDDLWSKGFVLYPVTRSHDGGVQVVLASGEHPDVSLRPLLKIQYQ